MAGVGHATQQHERHQMPDVEAVGRGVEAGIDATAGRGEPLTELARVGRLVDQAAGLEIGDKVVWHKMRSLPPHVVVGEGVRGAGEAVCGEGLHGLLGEPEVFP